MPKLVLDYLSKAALQLLIIPALLVTIAAVFIGVIKGTQAGCSVLLGIGMWLIPNLYFTRQLFSNVSPRAARQIIRRMYRAEVIKLVFSAVILIGIISVFHVLMGYFLVGYGAAQILFWLTCLAAMKTQMVKL